ncbi:hypothetical protein RCH21_003353 [Arthrobacter sp. PL16]|uniref:hypothetical protein n=1 Tax=Arthrobacter sp. PL16 TaxID=3071720 RepID=UPI002E02DB34|nr:hypothetical protein [Arthrobacter sp. PL16]
MSLLDREEETQRVLINAAMMASDISCRTAWRRYTEYTGMVDQFGISAYLAGLVALPVEECNLLAHAVNELIDERPPPLKAPHRGPTPWSLGPTSGGEHDKTRDELLTRWLMDTSAETRYRWEQ